MPAVGHKCPFIKQESEWTPEGGPSPSLARRRIDQRPRVTVAPRQVVPARGVESVKAKHKSRREDGEWAGRGSLQREGPADGRRPSLSCWTPARLWRRPVSERRRRRRNVEARRPPGGPGVLAGRRSESFGTLGGVGMEGWAHDLPVSLDLLQGRAGVTVLALHPGLHPGSGFVPQGAEGVCGKGERWAQP